jgi:hypothetical protein
MLSPGNFSNLPEIKGAIWHPYFSARLIKRLMLIISIVIVFMASVLPASPETVVQQLMLNIFIEVPVVKAKSLNSIFPFASGVTYGFSILAGFFLALMACFAKINVAPYRSMTGKMSFVSRLVWFFGFLLMLASFWMLDFKPSEFQFSFGFFKLVNEKRVFLSIWSLGSALGTFMCSLYLIFEVTTFLKFLFLRSEK